MRKAGTRSWQRSLECMLMRHWPKIGLTLPWICLARLRAHAVLVLATATHEESRSSHFREIGHTSRDQRVKDKSHNNDQSRSKLQCVMQVMRSRWTPVGQ